MQTATSGFEWFSTRITRSPFGRVSRRMVSDVAATLGVASGATAAKQSSAKPTIERVRMIPPRALLLGFLKHPDDFLRFGIPAYGLLGEEDLAIQGDVEDSAPAGNQLRINPESFLQLGRQTGGPG